MSKLLGTFVLSFVWENIQFDRSMLFFLSEGSTSRLQHLKKVFEEAIKEAEVDSDGDELRYWKQDGKQGII